MKLVIDDRRSGWLFGTAIILNVVQWVVVALWPATDVAPLHYTIYFGIDLTGPIWYLYALPGAGSVIIILHYLFALLQPSLLWRRVWALTGLIFLVLLMAALATLRFVTRL